MPPVETIRRQGNEPEFKKYRVRGKNALVSHSWIDENGNRQEKMLKEGDELELTEKQAREVGGKVELVDAKKGTPRSTGAPGETKGA